MYLTFKNCTYTITDVILGAELIMVVNQYYSLCVNEANTCTCLYTNIVPKAVLMCHTILEKTLSLRTWITE